MPIRVRLREVIEGLVPGDMSADFECYIRDPELKKQVQGQEEQNKAFREGYNLCRERVLQKVESFMEAMKDRDGQSVLTMSLLQSAIDVIEAGLAMNIVSGEADRKDFAEVCRALQARVKSAVETVASKDEKKKEASHHRPRQDKKEKK